MKKERIDKLLTEKGFAESRAKAHAMIMAGVVLVNEKRVDKPSTSFPLDAVIRIKGDSPESRYASRAGLKLEAGLLHFQISPVRYVCLDIGSSTGGFTDCLLQHGAGSVVALDVGTNQLAWKLRSDPRVDVREKTNARDLQPGDFRQPFDLIVIDVSFISLTKILAGAARLLRPGGRVIALIKPQFEVGKNEVGKGGIVREADKHERVVNEVNAFALTVGLELMGTIASPITGAEGNVEFLSCYELSRLEQAPASAPRLVEDVDFYFEDGLMVLTGEYLLRRGKCCDSGCRHCPYKRG